LIDEDTSWQKQLLVGAGLLLVVGLLVGGIIGLVALKAADVAGVGETPTPDTGPPPGLGLTTARPATTAPLTLTTRPAPTTPPTPTTRTAPTTPPTTQTFPTFPTPPTTQTTEPTPTTTTTTRTPQPPPQEIQLVATPLQATSFERVSLSGTYPAPAGTVLQVERNRGAGWEEFPTTATVDAGAFSTYVATGILGPNQFRVVDTSTGELSNVVIVQIS
jgi:hypothetical protein